MSRKLRWLIFAGILFSFFCGMVADKVVTSFIDDYQYQSVHKWAKMTIGELHEWISNEVPIGTSRKHVVFFLDRNLIEHFGQDATSSPDLLLAVLPGIKSTSLFVNTGVAITFTFKDNKLASYKFEKRLTGM